MILLLKGVIGSVFYFTMHFIISRSFITVFYFDKRQLLCWSGIKFQSISAANGFKARLGVSCWVCKWSLCGHLLKCHFRQQKYFRRSGTHILLKRTPEKLIIDYNFGLSFEFSISFKETIMLDLKYKA
jgi:hypothetical protein